MDLEDFYTGETVLCNTKHGLATGKIVTILESDQDERYSWVTKNIVGKEGRIPVDRIVVPENFKNSRPSIIRIKDVITSYYANGEIPDGVIVHADDCILKDGYIRYLVARMFGVKTIKCLFEYT